MADTYRDNQVERARHRTNHEDVRVEQHASPRTGIPDGLSLVRAMALDRGTPMRGIAATRAAGMKSAQSTYGNRALQRLVSRRSGGAEQESDDLAERIDSLSGKGSPIDPRALGRIEASMGVDLSGVRVHTGKEADHLAQDVEAVAFTTGQDIFFRSGAYDPHSPYGLRILAHEVAHTVQQAAGPVAGTPQEGGVSVSDPSDRFEEAAEAVAHEVVSVDAAGPEPRAALRASMPMPSTQRASGASAGAAPVQRILPAVLAGAAMGLGAGSFLGSDMSDPAGDLLARSSVGQWLGMDPEGDNSVGGWIGRRLTTLDETVSDAVREPGVCDESGVVERESIAMRINDWLTPTSNQ